MRQTYQSDKPRINTGNNSLKGWKVTSIKPKKKYDNNVGDIRTRRTEQHKVSIRAIFNTVVPRR